tara:strand:- start:502 stop:684 length:183 start_codon:yes stop_codon:yes gene_type:complete
MTKKYHVLMSEVHSVWYFVEAKDEKDAINKVSCGDYIESEDKGCEMGSQEFCEIEEYEDD